MGCSMMQGAYSNSIIIPCCSKVRNRAYQIFNKDNRYHIPGWLEVRIYHDRRGLLKSYRLCSICGGDPVLFPAGLHSVPLPAGDRLTSADRPIPEPNSKREQDHKQVGLYLELLSDVRLS